MNQIEPIQNLNEICENKNSGLYKQWIYEKTDFMKMCNYMQKINYSLQDLNSEIKNMDKLEYKDIVFIISLVDWVKEAYDKIYSVIKTDIKDDFVFSKELEIQEARQYLRAIRSFIVGHPLSTSQHKKYKLDGNFICVDVRTPKHHLNLFLDNFYYCINYNGLIEKKKNDVDFYLYCYSDKDDNMKYFRFVGCYLNDIYNVARLYIQQLYELNKFLSRKKKKDYE